MEEKKFLLMFDSRRDGSRYRQALEHLREQYGDFQIRFGSFDDGRVRVSMSRICSDTLAVRRDLESLARRLNESPEWTAAKLTVYPVKPFT